MSKAGEKFQEVLKKLEAEEKRKVDLVLPINSLRVNEDFTFESEDTGKVRLTEYAFHQLCSEVYNYTLPADYFRKLFEDNPERFTEQLNYHLVNGRGLKRKLRMVKDEIGEQAEVRGIVSESYTAYDNVDTLRAFMDTSKQLPEYELKNFHLDDRIMFARIAFPETEKNFGRSYDGQDDRNFVAIDLVNSEVGSASVVANPSIFRLICTNGLVARQSDYGLYKQRHRSINPYEVTAGLKKSIIHGVETGVEMLGTFQQARKIVVSNPYELITDYGKRRAMSDKMLKTVRDNYDIEADKSLFGIVNGFTRTARDIKSLDKRIELEKYAMTILEKELKKSA